MGNVTHVNASQHVENDLYAAGRFALQRHATARDRAPKRAAAVYLRLALTCARHLAKLAPKHADFWALAQTLAAEIILLAHQHEAALFGQGGNQGSVYINVWIAAEAFQIQLADQMAKDHAAASLATDPVTPKDTAQIPVAVSAREPDHGSDPLLYDGAQEEAPDRVAPIHAPHLAAYRAPQVVNHVRVAPKGKPSAASKNTSRPRRKPRR